MFHMWMVRYNIVIGLYVLDMWSVLCVPYTHGCCGLIYSDRTYVLDMCSVLRVPYVGIGV